MTSFISVFCLIVITSVVNLSSSGAVPNLSLQQDHQASNVRNQRFLEIRRNPQRRKHKKLRKLRKTKRRQEKKSKSMDSKSAKVQTNSVSRMKGRQSEFDGIFQHCDYLDLTEVGYRQTSDFNCAPGDKIIFKVCTQNILCGVISTCSNSLVIED